MNIKDCKHMQFSASVEVNRLEDSARFVADIWIKCSECGLPFSFLGLPAGVDLEGATVSIDGTEGRFAITPGSLPLALRSTYHLRKQAKQ